MSNLPRLREFLHRIGRDTNQGEIAFEFDGRFYRIRNFDTKHAEGQPCAALARLDPVQVQRALSDKEWEKLEELAAAIGTPGFAPSAGQVASVLLSLSLDSVAAQVGDDTPSSQVARELRRQLQSMR